MPSNCVPTLNEIIFNPPVLEDFLIENKQNRSNIIQFLQTISHDLFNGRGKESKVYQMIVDLVARITRYFKLSIIDLEGLFCFKFNKQVYEILMGRDAKEYSVEYFRLFLRYLTHSQSLANEENKGILAGMIQKYWSLPEKFTDELFFEDLQNYFVNGSKTRSEIYRLFKIKPSQFLLDALQSESFGLPWFVSNYSSTDQLSLNEREFFFQLIRSSALLSHIDQALGMTLRGCIDFFNSKCFMEIFFVKLLVADYPVIREMEEQLVRGNEALFRDCANFYMNMNSNQLEQFHLLPFFPSFKPKNHLFLFFLVVARFQLEHLFPSLDFILPAIHQQLPIEASSTASKSKTKNVLLTGLEYEIFNFQQLIQLHNSCTNDQHWKWLKQIFSSLGSIESPESLIECAEKDLQFQISSILLYGGIYWLERKEYSRSFSFLSSSLKHSLKQSPFPSLKFASFCKNALFEVCFILVNEIQRPENLALVCNAIHLLNNQIPANCKRILFLCANLINHGLANFAIDFAKNFLQVAGKRKDPPRQTISLLKMLYNSCICISLFWDKQEREAFSDWSPKHISLLVNASDSLFRNISGDQDVQNLFVGFLSLLEGNENYLNDFVGLFIGNLNYILPESDLVCLKYFSKYALFYAKNSANNAKLFSPTTSIQACNQELSAYYRPTLGKKDNVQFNLSTLKSVIISLHERPTCIEYFYSNSDAVLGLAEIVFLQGKFQNVITILVVHLMNVSKHFTIQFEMIENFPLILERIAICLWKLGQFDDLLLFSQLLEKKSKFWHASQLCKLDMLNEKLIETLFDIDLIEYLAVEYKNDSLQKLLINNGQNLGKCKRREVENRILKFIAVKFLGF